MSLARFEDVQDVFFSDESLRCSCILPIKFHINAQDRICVMPVGWRNINEAIYENAIDKANVTDEILHVCLESHVLAKLSTSVDYQLLYISGDDELYAVSSPFQIQDRPAQHASSEYSLISHHKSLLHESLSTTTELREIRKLIEKESRRNDRLCEFLESETRRMDGLVDFLRTKFTEQSVQIKTLTDAVQDLKVALEHSTSNQRLASQCGSYESLDPLPKYEDYE